MWGEFRVHILWEETRANIYESETIRTEGTYAHTQKCVSGVLTEKEAKTGLQDKCFMCSSKFPRQRCKIDARCVFTRITL